ncbi:MAG: aspartate carbamoyltransferase regulatory subunit [Clostridia bacterium]|nr:aspartate carbamoyltransferase regulatory subunit [Clostridia bacterium]
MTIDSIRNGLVIDHITAGKAMELYRLLKLDKADCPVALIQRVPSRKMGTKDIIKIDGEFDVDVDILGYVDPDATVNVIRDGVITEKKALTLPEKLTNVLCCKNPRCITTTEQELTSVFTLTDKDNRVYRCLYCEAKAER